METTAKTERFADEAGWLDARRTTGIGASEVAAVLGVSRYMSPLQLFHKKLGLEPVHKTEVERMWWGRVLEGPITMRYADETRRQLSRQVEGNGPVLLRHPVHTHLVCTLDAEVAIVRADAIAPPAGGPGALEAKNVHEYMGQQWLEDEEPPVEYQLQLQAQLAVTGWEWGSIAALIGGHLFAWADLKRDEDLIAMIFEEVAKFWARLERQDPPPADGSERTKDLLAKLYPKDSGETIALPGESVDWDALRLEGEALIEQGKAKKDLADNLFRQAIGEATCGTLPNGITYSWKHQKRAGYTVEPTEFRVLRRQKAKEKSLKGKAPALPKEATS